MNPSIQHHAPPSRRMSRGFALVVTLSLMILLTVIAVGLLSLSSISLRSSSQGIAQSEAKANARLALMIAIGELQKEMGPDMRVSAESALLDTNKNTATIEGVAQSRWLASYNSWGDWLNAEYAPPGGIASKISATYTPGRKSMFRRWLLSMPEGDETKIDAPNSVPGTSDPNWVELVAKGSLGDNAPADQITRAYLTKVVKNNVTTGKYAWWVGGENHKARIDMAKEPTREPDTVAAWETSQGDTAEVGVGALDGFDALDNDKTLGDKLITTQSLRPAGIVEDKVKEHFFDLTASSRGVLASVRTGHLKKDLSLLFEQKKANLPDQYRFDVGDVMEPSIRPMTQELRNYLAQAYPDPSNPPLVREFAPWARMRHFYRMYRQDSDAEAPGFPEGTSRSNNSDCEPALSWDGSRPWTDCSQSSVSADWDGQDSYPRFPIVTHITYILKLRTTPSNSSNMRDLKVFTLPVYVLWNPYNVELRVPDKAFSTGAALSETQPLGGIIHRPDGKKEDVTQINWNQFKAPFSSHDGPNLSDVRDDIVFKPGEFRIFSPTQDGQGAGNSGSDDSLILHPGFDPTVLGGDGNGVGDGGHGSSAKASVNEDPPRYEFRFSWGTYHKFNTTMGNTPGSFVAWYRWLPDRDPNRSSSRVNLPLYQHVDWLNTSQVETRISPVGGDPFIFTDNEPIEVGYLQLVLKGLHDRSYPTISWEKDWRCRNWIQAPPFYTGKGLYISEDDSIANTQRIDSPYEFRFGPMLGGGLDFDDVVQNKGDSALMGPEQPITAAPALELPTAPIGSLAGFSGMRLNPGWVKLETLNSKWGRNLAIAGTNTTGNSLYSAESKANAYQSGITGPGIGNSFLHPMIRRTDVYRFLDNSISMEMKDEADINAGYSKTDTKAYCDYWDHVFLLNDALWDDYFVSSLADQARPGASVSSSLDENLQKLVNGEELVNSRYMPYLNGRTKDEVKGELNAADGYLKAASHLMVDGMFNVNSTSVDAWHALFAGIRERKVVYRDQNGTLKPVDIPSDKRIAVSRFNVATTNKDGNDPVNGVSRDDGMDAWSDVRFLDEDQLRKLAEECVKQVKRRGPFLNFSEFINRRLSDDDLGTMGALQSAIDYDDGSPKSGSINYDFKSDSDFMLKEKDLGNHAFASPEAAVGSRFAGIPGYVIQSDLLKPIANTLSVRDDTFRIRAYGESVDKTGKVVARAWCEAIVQRVPEYSDDANKPEVPTRKMSPEGGFSKIEDSELTPANRLFGRKFQIESFRWLNGSEI